MTSAMTEPKITRDRIEHWREHLTYIEPLHADELSALCTLALQALAMQPRPIGPEQKDGSMLLASSVNHDTKAVVGWNSRENCWTDVGGENAAHTLMIGESYFTHFIPLNALPEPRR